MTWRELAEQCVDSINHSDRSPREPLITLCWKGKCPFPRSGWPRMKRMLCVNRNGEKVAHYDARKVLAAMAEHGIIKVELNERPKQIATLTMIATDAQDAGNDATEVNPAQHPTPE